MANVKVVIEEIVKGKGSVKAVSNDINTLETASRRVTTSVRASSFSLTDFSSALGLVRQGLQLATQAYGAVITQHLEYADRVRQLSTLSGESAEETSRFVQVLDDYKISAEDALTATRALTKEGYTPSIDTLAQLSDQYLAITDTQERNEFVIKNLGKSGLQWVEVLNKGSDAIRAQGDAVSDSLILNQKMLDDARRAEVAMDNWSDSIEEVKTMLAVHLLPTLTDSADGILWLTKTSMLFFDAVKEGKLAEFDLVEALRQTRDEIEGSEQAMLDSADAADANAESLDGLTDSAEDTEKAAKALSQVYQGLLSSMFSINTEQENYQQKLDDLNKSTAELAAEKDRLTLAMWEEQRAGEMTNEEYLKYIQQLDEITKKQEENAQAITDAAADHERAATQRVYDLAQERLAADGVIDSGEFEYLQQIAVQKGLVSQAAADQAIAESKAADELVASFAKTQDPMNAALATMQQIASMDGHIVNFGVNFTQTGSMDPTAFSGGNGLGQAGGGVGGGVGGGGSRPRARRSLPLRDNGGPGIAGTPYQVGVPEVFVAPSNGQFIPLHGAQNASLGNTYNITVHNPVRETAENSIRQQLKRLSYIGVIS